jgi:DNA polymerase I
MENKNKLVLIDAYALIYRAYYAFINSQMYSHTGVNTSAVYGFALAVDEAIKALKPTHLAVAFDSSGPTFRHEKYADYKGNRQETPDVIKQSIPIILEFLKAINIPVIRMPGYEADDIIGTLAVQSASDDTDVYIVSSDKDFAQLLDNHIYQYRPGKSGKPADILDREKIVTKYGIDTPIQFIDILALWGDSSDNVPGVPGIGEKGALKLVQQFKTVENVIENLQKVPDRFKVKIEENIDKLHLYKYLVTILCTVPVGVSLDDLGRKPGNTEEIRKLFTDLNFKSLLSRFSNATEKPVQPKQQVMQPTLFDMMPVSLEQQPAESVYKTIKTEKKDYKLISTLDELNKIQDEFVEVSEFAIDTETTSLDPLTAGLVGISLSRKADSAYYINFYNSEIQGEIISFLNKICNNTKQLKIGHNLKYDILVLGQHSVSFQFPVSDTMLAHYLVQPEMGHKLDDLSVSYLGYEPIHIEELIGKKGPQQKNMKDLQPSLIVDYACEDADLTFQVFKKLQETIKVQRMEKLLEMENKLMLVLADIERTGIAINKESLREFGKVLEKLLHETELSIYELAGEKFNLNSPKQLGDILFEKLKIEYTAKKTKTKQYSTNEETLQELSTKHPIIEKVLEYRGISKLLSTYIESIITLIGPTGRIHTSFNQSVTSTGRLSSTNPNLQNIPIREERGKEIRKAFISSAPDNILLSADYSQIELRVMAHISQDANMIQAFLDGHDIHNATAATLFNVSLTEITKEQRRIAKTANFGIIYGISAFGLSQRLGIPRGQSQAIIQDYFKTFPGVHRYMQLSIEKAREKGYTETLLGRRRFLPEIHSGNATVRAMAERNAINTPIQGTAADIIKMAMVNIANVFKEKGIASKMVLQVHDELLFDVVPNEKELVISIVRQEMEQVMHLTVPLIVDMGYGKNWLEAH